MRAWLRVLGAVGGLCAASVHAQAPQSPAPEPAALKVAVLRGTSGEAGELAQAVDAALLRDLEQIAGIEAPTVSPVDYAEIRLTVGCEDEGRACLASIARTVEVDAIVVRKLAVDDAGAQLALMYFDAQSVDEPARAERRVPADAQELAGAVPALVRELFGLPEPVHAAAPESESESEPEPEPEPAAPTAPPATEAPRVSTLTWVGLGAGAVLLGAGIVVGLDAQSSFDEWKQRDVVSEAGTRQADSDLTSIESQGTASALLLATGGVVLALGGTLLALELSQDESAPRVALTPRGDGLSLHLSTTMEGL